MSTTAPWPGQWVADRLGVTLHGEGLHELVGLALRRNPRRAHLLVSNVLGKHVPQLPAVVYGHGHALGRRVRDLLGADAAGAVVLGYAETATALGHAVADGLDTAPYLHSTRRAVPGVVPGGGFQEEHSHATGHLLLPADPALLGGTAAGGGAGAGASPGPDSGPDPGRPATAGSRGPLVLVDDEFSTGRTIRNTIADLHSRHPRTRYVVVALADLRSAADRARLDAFAADLGARVDVVALVAGRVALPADVLDRGRALVEAHDPAPGHPLPYPHGAPGPARRVDLGWPAGLPDGGRHGFLPHHRAALAAALPAMGARLAAALPARAARMLVLGTEELMYAPLRLAGALQEALPADGPVTYFSTTTRSPVLAVDDPGYAIRSRIVFPAHDEPRDGDSRERYAYNVAGAGFDAIVCVVDSAGDTPALHAPDGLLARLAAHTPAVVLAVVPSYRPGAQPDRRPGPAPGPYREPKPEPEPELAPAPEPGLAQEPKGTTSRMSRTAGALAEPLRGPGFSSYRPEEVGWLLKDLSAVELEAPVEEREEAVQSGGAHYAESLPVEYQPSAEYQDLFRAALTTSAERIARAVGAVTELVLAERGPEPVLVSLARAGTPVGVLMRRWAAYAHGLSLPHYAVSIVRGRGIDTNALRWLAAHHAPGDAVFVDGWTGKGAITRELAAALRDFGAGNGDGDSAGNGGERAGAFDPRVAVLADPGGCVSTYGTRDDFLIPSACLNSTVSGLVSRTVLRADLIGPDDFHGAKFYRELAGADLSGLFLDTVSAAFDTVDDQVAADVAELRTQDRRPTWAGWTAVEKVAATYGIHDLNLVKPGVGETTRVLLRRVPWRILTRRGAGADLDHVRLLAEQRGVPTEEVDGLPYSCVGLIHPHYTRGATGADGRAVATR